MTTPSLRHEADRLQRLKRNAVYVPAPPDIEPPATTIMDIIRWPSPLSWSMACGALALGIAIALFT